MQVRINWNTAQEQEVYHYEVLRSTDCKDFITIGKTSATFKAMNECQFIDANPAKGVNHYRLAVVKADESVDYNTVRTVRFSDDAVTVNIHPNPVKDVLYIDGIVAGAKGSIRILSAGGQVVRQSELGTMINVEQLPAGNYFIEVMPNNTTFNYKLIKQ